MQRRQNTESLTETRMYRETSKRHFKQPLSLSRSLCFSLPVYLDQHSRKFLHRETACCYITVIVPPTLTEHKALHHRCCSISVLASVLSARGCADTFQTSVKTHTHIKQTKLLICLSLCTAQSCACLISLVCVQFHCPLSENLVCSFTVNIFPWK